MRANNLTDERLPCPCCGGKGTILNKESAGTRMRAYRTERSVSLRSTATKMGISKAYLSDLENGLRGWTDERVEGFKKAVEALAKSDRKR